MLDSTHWSMESHRHWCESNGTKLKLNVVVQNFSLHHVFQIWKQRTKYTVFM